jgi:trehalose 6-phosphate phosphatase
MPSSPDLRTVLEQRPLGLVFDIDGTLSTFARVPDEARLDAGVAELLEQVSQYAHLAIITGRGLEDAVRIVNIDGLTYIGTHGLEWSDGLPPHHSVQLLSEARPYVKPGAYLLDYAEKELATLQGLVIQRKHIGGTLHYRLARDPQYARARIFAALEEPARHVGMRLREGKRVVEILAPLNVNKGHGLRRFVERYGLRGVLFAGDDLTDLDAVLEIERLRREGLAALSVVVQYNDTPPEMLEHADIRVQHVAGMIELLSEIVAELQESKQQS